LDELKNFAFFGEIEGATSRSASSNPPNLLLVQPKSETIFGAVRQLVAKFLC
jgi:hypothetical protein